jgi:hypothetical protein
MRFEDGRRTKDLKLLAKLWRDAEEELQSMENPLHARREAAEPAASAPLPRRDSWESVTDEDGDSFYLHRASGATAWQRPSWLLALEPAGQEHFFVDQHSGASRWDRPAAGYAGPDEAGWELVLDVASGARFRWHAESGQSEWLPGAGVEAQAEAQAQVPGLAEEEEGAAQALAEAEALAARERGAAAFFLSSASGAAAAALQSSPHPHPVEASAGLRHEQVLERAGRQLQEHLGGSSAAATGSGSS